MKINLEKNKNVSYFYPAKLLDLKDCRSRHKKLLHLMRSVFVQQRG